MNPLPYHISGPSGRRPVLYYVTGHGFGHAVRASLVIRELVSRHGFPVTVRTNAPAWLFPEGGTVEPADVDAGIIQKDALTPDLDATVGWWRDLLFATWDQRLAVEQAAINRIDPAIVVGDIAPLGVAAGKASGRATVVVANFLWDWIFEGYAAVASNLAAMADRIGEIYDTADAIFRTPFSDGLERHPNVVDIPLIARRSALTKEEARRTLGLPADQPLALVSMGGAGLDRFFHRLDRRLTVARPFAFGDDPGEREGVLVLPRSCFHPDGVVAADLVIGKLGYGLCGEVAATGRSLLYTPRTDFVEYFTLAREIRRLVPTEEVDETLFFSGTLDQAVERLLGAPTVAPTIAIDGAARAADLIEERSAR